MPRVNFPVPIYIPERLYGLLSELRKRSRVSGSTINLLGDRDIEWSWIASEIPNATGDALDFGPGGSSLGLIAAMSGYQVLSIDLEQVYWPYSHPRITFIQGDILKTDISSKKFDLIINCSAIEHVGLAGRYSNKEAHPDGDLEAMQILRNAMKIEKGIMLLTIPVGKDAIFSPLARVYGVNRLPKLLNGFEIRKEYFWIKDKQNIWLQTDRHTALEFDASVNSWNPLKNRYALGCFILGRNI